MVLAEIEDSKYYIQRKLHEKWTELKSGKLVKEDDDKVYIVDGRERSGKSLWTIQQAAYIDPTLISDALENDDLSRITFTGEETLNAIQKTTSTEKQTKVIIFDEAFRGLSSRSVLSKTNKLIVQALMEMGQKNLVLFIVLPSFFLLDRYPAVLRSNALFHIEKEKQITKAKGRTFKVYNYQKKAQLYNLRMDKGWSYPIKTRFRGKFYGKWPGGDEFEKLYRKRKKDSLMEMDKVTFKEFEESKYIKQRDIVINLLYQVSKWSKVKIADELTKKGYEISPSTIRRAVTVP